MTPTGFAEDSSSRTAARTRVAQLEKDYITVFGSASSRTDAQRAVLADMERRFCVFSPLTITGSVDTNEMLLKEGKRQTVLFIHEVVNNHILTRNLTEEERNSHV